jgi:glutaredoxin-like protein NrdH
MVSASHPNVIIYTTPTCPDCHMLKAWLEREGVAFEERDITSPKIMEEAKARTGVRVAPITLVGERVFYGTFPSQKPGLSEALGLSAFTRNRAP